ncbi:multiple epidermal growth factor-like domains protein 10 isoform X1 [Dreissena polymorpha]|nr:multiple epidermal growth factor-like domains protein 10 isoform X1 [Dreissena polymorpha]
MDSFGLHCVNPCVCENNSTCNNVNGKCTCLPGYYGEYCHKKCDITSIGVSGCEQSCACQHGGICAAGSGKCICTAGYMGEYCAEPCDQYHYGTNCTAMCDCNNGLCNAVDGTCKCQLGFTGTRCEVQCPPGRYGEGCLQTCPCQNGGVCNFLNNTITCSCSNTGYHGYHCTERDCPDRQRYNSKTRACENCNCPWNVTQSCDVLTGSCQCKAGYRGDACQLPCAEPFYGVKCEQLCGCAERGKCHHVTGHCYECYAGYTGVNCTDTCPEGTWGSTCANSCGCLHGATCHATSGFCNCSAGWTGTFCADPCPVDRYGRGCTQTCTCNLARSTCSPYDGACHCKPGYHGDDCATPCIQGMYGFQCRYNCTCDPQGSLSCDSATGECLCKPGWHGIRCSSQCPSDSWGAGCTQPCNCTGRGTCDHYTGMCLCRPGYQGDRCQSECSANYYGDGCKLRCPTCGTGTQCDKMTGQCVRIPCPPGLQGTNCDHSCPSGTWGTHCESSCSRTCMQHGFCNPVNGVCHCHPGYLGAECDTACPQGKYGVGCDNDCACVMVQTQKCDVTTGRCDCKAGYTGKFCETEQEGIGGSMVHQKGEQGSSVASAGSGSTVVVVCSVVGALLLLVIIALAVYFSRKMQRLKKESLGVHFGSDSTLSYGPPAGGTVGVVNPTYEAQNLRNEGRYPHLSQRATRPPLPQRHGATCEEFDDITHEKLQVAMGTSTGCCPTSEPYPEPEEDRYTTLSSVAGGQRRDHHDDSDVDYKLYKGKMSPTSFNSDQSTQGSRSEGRGVTGFVNSAYDEGPVARSVGGVNQPLYDLDPEGHVDPYPPTASHLDYPTSADATFSPLPVFSTQAHVSRATDPVSTETVSLQPGGLEGSGSQVDPSVFLDNDLQRLVANRDSSNFPESAA